MVITYRRTGGGFALIVLAAALVAMGITVALAVVLGIVAAAMGTVVLLVRALLPSPRRRQTTPAATPWPLETIDVTVVTPHGSSDEGDPRRLDSGKRVIG